MAKFLNSTLRLPEIICPLTIICIFLLREEGIIHI